MDIFSLKLINSFQNKECKQFFLRFAPAHEFKIQESSIDQKWPNIDFFLSIIPKLIKRFNICVSKCVCESVFLWVYVLTVIRQPFVCPFTVLCIYVSLHQIYVQFYLDLQINVLLFYKRFCSFVLCLILELRCYECCHICFKILNWSLWRAYMYLCGVKHKHTFSVSYYNQLYLFIQHQN